MKYITPILVFVSLMTMADIKADEVRIRGGCLIENVRVLEFTNSSLIVETTDGKILHLKRKYIGQITRTPINTDIESKYYHCLESRLFSMVFEPSQQVLDSLAQKTDNNYYPILSDGNLHFIDSTGQSKNTFDIKVKVKKTDIVVKSVTKVYYFEYSPNTTFRNGVLLVQEIGGSTPLNHQYTYACYTHQGIKLFEKKAYWMGAFSEGLAQIKVPKKFLFIKRGYHFGYVNRQGEYQIKPRFEYAGNFSEGMAHVRKDNKYGYINRYGDFVIRPVFEYAKGFSDSLAVVKFESKYGYIDHKGQFVVKPAFDEAWDFKTGVARVMLDGKFGYINKEGQFIFPPNLEFGLDFSDSLACIRHEGQIGYLNTSGGFEITPQYENGGSYSVGVAPVEINGKWGYIDKSGQIKIPAKYELAYPFVNQLGIVWQQELPYYIDDKGVILRPVFN